MSSDTPLPPLSSRSHIVEDQLGKLRAMISKYAAPVPTDYLHALPPDLRQHAASDRAPPYNPINNNVDDKPTLSLLQVSRSMTTTQAFGRPFEGFSEEQVLRAFHLGDTEGAPPSSPAPPSKSPSPPTANSSLATF